MCSRRDWGSIMACMYVRYLTAGSRTRRGLALPRMCPCDIARGLLASGFDRATSRLSRNTASRKPITLVQMTSGASSPRLAGGAPANV